MYKLVLPITIKSIIVFLSLDALLYFQHRASPKVSVLWRRHRVHHADTGSLCLQNCFMIVSNES